MSSQQRRLIFWGTYDTGKPRVRLLLEGARAAGFDVHTCHYDVWRGVEDKSQLRSKLGLLLRLVRWLLAYPALILRYLRLPAHSQVLVPYLGQLDVLVLWPFARLRRARLAWDVFLPLYDLMVEDRRLAAAGSIKAKTIFAIEWLACRACDTLFLDTAAHAKAFEQRYGLPPGRVGHLFVGAEGPFERRPWRDRSPQPTLLFYGQFIPLHGLETLLRAARLVLPSRPGWRLLVVGEGQEAPRIDALLTQEPIAGVERLSWIPYDELPGTIAEAWICLGIFGTSQKARSVIPNKVFQVLAVGRPLITAESPAIREWLRPNAAVRLVAPGDEKALAEALISLIDATSDDDPRLLADLEALPRYGAGDLAKELTELLQPAHASASAR